MDCLNLFVERRTNQFPNPRIIGDITIKGSTKKHEPLIKHYKIDDSFFERTKLMIPTRIRSLLPFPALISFVRFNVVRLCLERASIEE